MKKLLVVLKKLLVISFMLIASFTYSQDYQQDYKNLYGWMETHPENSHNYNRVIIRHGLHTEKDSSGKIIKQEYGFSEIEFLKTGIKLLNANGNIYYANIVRASFDLYDSRNNQQFRTNSLGIRTQNRGYDPNATKDLAFSIYIMN